MENNNSSTKSDIELTIESNLKKVKLLMDEYSITQGGMAEKIGMNKETFRTKFNDNCKGNKFKISEINKMILVLNELSEKIKKFELNFIGVGSNLVTGVGSDLVIGVGSDLVIGVGSDLIIGIGGV